MHVRWRGEILHVSFLSFRIPLLRAVGGLTALTELELWDDCLGNPWDEVHNAHEWPFGGPMAQLPELRRLTRLQRLSVVDGGGRIEPETARALGELTALRLLELRHVVTTEDAGLTAKALSDASGRSTKSARRLPRLRRLPERRSRDQKTRPSD